MGSREDSTDGTMIFLRKRGQGYGWFFWVGWWVCFLFLGNISFSKARGERQASELCRRWGVSMEGEGEGRGGEFAAHVRAAVVGDAAPGAARP